MRKRTISVTDFKCEELNLTPDKGYHILEATNEGQEYINEYIFKIQNDVGEEVWVDEYCVDKVPRIIHRLFADRVEKRVKFD